MLIYSLLQNRTELYLSQIVFVDKLYRNQSKVGLLSTELNWFGLKHAIGSVGYYLELIQNSSIYNPMDYRIFPPWFEWAFLTQDETPDLEKDIETPEFERQHLESFPAPLGTHGEEILSMVGTPLLNGQAKQVGLLPENWSITNLYVNSLIRDLTLSVCLILRVFSLLHCEASGNQFDHDSKGVELFLQVQYIYKLCLKLIGRLVHGIASDDSSSDQYLL